jgi:hypothetical protein
MSPYVWGDGKSGPAGRGNEGAFGQAALPDRLNLIAITRGRRLRPGVAKCVLAA